jgi:hypothetical protein
MQEGQWGLGIDRGGGQLATDDFVLVDLDNNMIESTIQPTSLPRHQRRKLLSLLQLAAPHHGRYQVPTGPPAFDHIIVQIYQDKVIRRQLHLLVPTLNAHDVRARRLESLN